METKLVLVCVHGESGRQVVAIPGDYVFEVDSFIRQSDPNWRYNPRTRLHALRLDDGILVVVPVYGDDKHGAATRHYKWGQSPAVFEAFANLDVTPFVGFSTASTRKELGHLVSAVTAGCEECDREIPAKRFGHVPEDVCFYAPKVKGAWRRERVPSRLAVWLLGDHRRGWRLLTPIDMGAAVPERDPYLDHVARRIGRLSLVGASARRRRQK
jgi:hypothetical protein